MLTRLVRIQLTIFAVFSVIGMTAMAVNYIQVPTLLGIGRITVTVELPATGGLYRFGNVTYRGMQMGRVTDVRVVRKGHRPIVEAELSLMRSPRVPADLVAGIHSVSAIGEIYVDLRPRTSSGPFLRDGSVIASSDVVLPPQVGPMLDQVNALVDSVPEHRISDLLDESFKAFNGAGYDLSSLIDSSSKVAGDLNSVADRVGTLFDDSRPLIESQAETADSLRLWTRSLAGVTEQITDNDAQIRTLLSEAPGAADQATSLLEQVQPTLPILLANLTTVGQIGLTYNKSLETLFVIVPPVVGYTQAINPTNNATGLPIAVFRASASDPPACTVGFLPPSAWRSPADETVVDTPDGLHCKLPQDSPLLVRGARNIPCMGVPGKRAPTVEECYSDKPFQPLAMRQHVTGPYPIDPNLVSQGIPVDSRVDLDERIHAPIEGTPLPPEAATGPRESPPAVPNAFTPGGPAVAIAPYDPQTGRYATPDGRVLQQHDLAAGAPKTWQQMLIPGGGL
ncbi:Uncharacterised protein [Mycolicibacterium vanbaalenii]|uniref:Mce/MlaD domain-containing protein n=1 Tax=Mycolicibacterium vanbaalenii TaxID=110539 RepID=A0A5S9QWX9_MYCVN|nr:MlaD family protein [Mycolicibacterium vanbaalenii]CAA0124555.1 Uncharacterised protein [Mycolicibacterium vanbaalenii]